MIEHEPSLRMRIAAPILALSALLSACSGANQAQTTPETVTLTTLQPPLANEVLGDVPNPMNQAWFPVTDQLDKVYNVTAHAELNDSPVVPGKEGVTRSVDITCIEARANILLHKPNTNDIAESLKGLLGNSLYSPAPLSDMPTTPQNKNIHGVEYRIYERQQTLLSAYEIDTLALALVPDVKGLNKLLGIPKNGGYWEPKHCLTSVTADGTVPSIPQETAPELPRPQN